MTAAPTAAPKSTKDWQTQPFDPEQFADSSWTTELQRLPAAVFRPGAAGADPRWQKLIAAMVNESRKRLTVLRDALLAEFVGKQEIVEMMVACAIANEPMLLIGPPGTAKSAMIRRFCQGLRMVQGEEAVIDEEGGRRDLLYFQYLLSRFTEPDELFGPLDIAAYRGERQVESGETEPTVRRIRRGMLTEASVVFLDEIFKANSAILNTLLSIINERIYYENGKAYPAMTRVIVGASNEVPRDQALRAFYERFPIRLLSRPISQDSAQFDLMRPLLERGWSLEQRHSDSKAAPEACYNDLVLLNRQVIDGCDDLTTSPAMGDYLEIVRQLNEDQSALCSIDDRKLIKLYKVVRALAAFEGDQENRRHLRILRYTWDQPQQAAVLAEAVDYFIEHPLQTRS
jgi:MoxR-like ATPase